MNLLAAKRLRDFAGGLVVLSLSLVAAAQSPKPDGAEVERRVDGLLNQMTLQEKIDLIGGVHVFDVRGIPRLGLPALGTADGPLGVRNDGPSTAMAAGIALAATWDPPLAGQVGTQIGRDARAKGKHFLLGPGVNIYRAPLNGRNFEYFGEDPWLASCMAAAYIQGMQSQGVSSTIKHFLGNNSEFGRHSTDSVIDERTLREIYLPSFETAVKQAHVGAIMDSYNLTNGEHMTQNGRLNNDVVKQEWGFKGVIMSDWDATYDTVGAANGGLDLEMPSGKFLNFTALMPAIKAGKVSQATVDDKVRRLLRTEIEFGWLDRPQLDETIPRYNPQGREVALEESRESMVLLKNDGNLLPLDKQKIRTLALIGPDAYPAVPLGGGSAQATAFHAVSFLEGLADYLTPAASVLYQRGVPSLTRAANSTTFSTAKKNGKPGLILQTFDNGDLAGKPTNTRVEPHLGLGAPIDIPGLSSGEIDFDFPAGPPHEQSMRWTGFYTPQAGGAYDIFVQTGGFEENGYRLYIDGHLLLDSWKIVTAAVSTITLTLDASPHKLILEQHAQDGLGGPFIKLGIVGQGTWTDRVAEDLAEKADAVVLAVGFDPASETEGMDRTFALPPGQSELIRAIAAKNRNTIVVVTSGGGVDMSPWIDRVAGVLEAWYPGQEGGTALPELLFGDTNPSGHLPATFERHWEDNPTHDNYYPEKGSNRIAYREGVFVGYRGYERNGTKPLFPFGYGLSYTSFQYGNLSLKRVGPAATSSSPRYEVSFDVTNTGKRAGAAVAQVYIAEKHASLPRPAKELKGFSRLRLAPGETRRATVPLDLRSFSFYDSGAKRWRADPGSYSVLVGDSSEQIELSGDLELDSTD